MNTNPSAKRILCFGDSLTWGYIPGTNHERYPADVRWPGILQDALGSQFEVIEEGLNSRGIENGDSRPGKEGRRALDYIEACLDSHDPVDFVIVLLGGNELKYANKQTPDFVRDSMHKLLNIIINRPSQSSKVCPAVILLAPPVIDETTEYCMQGDKYKGAHEKSKQLGKEYEVLANKLGLKFLNLSEFVEVGVDGVHIDDTQHKIVGAKVSSIFEE